MKKVMAMLLTMVLAMTLCACAPAEQFDIIDVYRTEEDTSYWSPALQYARLIELEHSGDRNGWLLATCERLDAGLSKERPGYPILRSTDGGATWELISEIRESAAAIQSEWNPHLYELPEALGDMPAGTLLCAAISIDAGHGRMTSIRLYRSFDQGESWEQYAFVATQNFTDTTAGAYEPFLFLLDDGRLACYYSDASDPNHSQKLVLALSEDGVNFDTFQDIVAVDEWKLRPGMAVPARMNDGRYIMVYEVCTDGDPNTGNPVYYRFSEDGVDWGDPKDLGTKLQTKSGVVPGSAPYVVYVPEVGENGLLIVTAVFQTPSGKNGPSIFLNDALGAEDQWVEANQPLRYRRGGYSHGMHVASDGHTVYFVNTIEDREREDGYSRLVFTKVDLAETQLK